MAAVLADFRAKYPQYKDVDDQRLADALYKKYYSHADRRAFDAKVGLKPYMTDLEGAAAAVGNIPAAATRSVQDLGLMGAEAAQRFVDPINQPEMTKPLSEIVEPGAPIAEMLDDKASPTYRSASVGALLPDEVRLPMARSAAEWSLRQQLSSAETGKQIKPLDVDPNSMAGTIAGVAGSATEMVAPAVVSLALRNPMPLVAYFGTRVLGESYGEARREGAGVDRAQVAAGLKAAAEVATEALAGKVFVEGGKTLLTTVLKTAGVEGLTEGATEALQALVDVGMLEEQMTVEQALARVGNAALIGSITGGIVSTATYPLRGKPEADPAKAPPAAPVTPAMAPPAADDPIEDRLALPAPETLLALPPPEAFAPPEIKRRQPQTQADVGIGGAQFGRDGKVHDATMNADGTISSPGAERDAADYYARVALQKTKQAETKELLQTARETVTPLGTFSTEEVGGPAAQRVKELRIRTGRSPEAPITIEDLARAKVPQKQIDAIIAARKPNVAQTALTPLDIIRSAEAKNIIADDSNFADLAYRTVGARDPMRMTQAQLNALKQTIDALPAHPAPVTVPLADAPPFTEDQYGKALDAVRKDGRYTVAAIKAATGLKSTKDLQAIRDTMVRRGQLVQRSANDFRLYDVVGEERQAVPDDLPPGAFKEYVVRRVPVAKVRIRKDGKAVGLYGSGAEARGKIRDLRLSETGKRSSIQIEPAEEVAYGVFENRYDEAGNLLGQVVVSSARDEGEAQKVARQLGTPAEPGPSFQSVEPNLTPEVKAPARKPVPPAALAGRTPQILKRLSAIAKQRRLPLLGVRVTVKPEVLTPDGRNIEGMFFQKLISIAANNLTPSMSEDQIVDALAGVMDHETIHALRQAGVLSPESDGWKTIVRYARRAKPTGSGETYFERAKRLYSGEPGYNTPADIEEEAIAEAFRNWAANRRNVVGKPATVFRQIVEWFKNLFRAIPDDVFATIESGQLVDDALRPPGAEQPRARATRDMQAAATEVAAAQAARDENLVRVKQREFLRARAQAREDRYGRSGPKTVLGTTPSRAYMAAPIGERGLAATAAEKFRAANGVPTGRLMTLLPEPVDYLARVADAQQRAVHDPGAADVAKAYRALVDETKAMFRGLGPLEVSAWTADGPPYASAAEMFDDLAAGRLRLRLSADLFGPGADNPGHPMNAASGVKTTDGRDLTMNDLFRVVHDVYGHGQSGFRDDPRGQYNAFHEHARLVSPLARRALATETLAQGAWANYGPHLRRSDGTVPRASDVDYLPPNQKEFAEQKAFVLDEDLLAADPGFALADAAALSEVGADPKFMVGYHGTPHKVDKFSSSKIGTGEGAQAFGYGLYFAGKKEVAEYYREKLSSPAISVGGVDIGQAHTFDADTTKAMESLGLPLDNATRQAFTYVTQIMKSDIADGRKTPEWSIAFQRKMASPNEKLVLDALENNVTVEQRGNLYKVDIPEDNELLDWDAPLSEQPKAIQDKIADLLGTDIIADLSGRDVYDSLRARLAKKPPAGSLMAQVGTPMPNAEAASEALRAAGIPGHRYLDGGSRGDRFVLTSDSFEKPGTKVTNRFRTRKDAEEFLSEVLGYDPGVATDRWAITEESLSRNYVIYDDSRVQILEENPKFSKFDDNLPGGRLYGNPARSPGGALSKPGTPSPAFTNARPGNAFFGGELAERQLEMARTGERGATMIYLSPEDFLALAGARGPEVGALPNSWGAIRFRGQTYTAGSHSETFDLLTAEFGNDPVAMAELDELSSKDIGRVYDGKFRDLNFDVQTHEFYKKKAARLAKDLASNQAVYDQALAEGYKFSGLPSLVLKGYAGNVRVDAADGLFMASALKSKDINGLPVVLYPKYPDKEGLGLITALEAPGGARVAFPREGFQEFIPSVRGPRWSVGSENFQKWFGDSKVIDANGAPKVVYHATSASFDVFKPGAQGRGMTSGPGVWFSDDPGYLPAGNNVGRSGSPLEGENVMPVFLSLQNPMMLDKEKNPEDLQYFLDKFRKPEFGETGWGFPQLLTPEVVADVRETGFDGVIYSYVFDGAKRTEYVAFEPTQIKSAVANNGQYDAANPDIRYSLNAPFGERVEQRPTPQEFDLYAPYTGRAHDPLDPAHSGPPDPTGLSPDTYNIVHQRVEGYMGRFLEALGRSKKSIPLLRKSIFEMRTEMLDEKMLSVKEMMEEAKLDHGVITYLNDAYVEEMLYHGKVYNQIDRREQTLYLDVMNTIKAELDKPATNASERLTLENIDDFLIAMHAPERNAYLRAKGSKEPNPSGVTDEWAMLTLDTLALEGKLPALEAIAAKVYAVIKDTNKTRFESGQISRDVYESQHFQYYVPMRGIALDELTVDDLVQPGKYNRGRGRGFSVRGKNDVKMRGRDRKATDIIGHTFMQNTESVIRAEKNNVAKAFIRFLLDNPALQERFGKVTTAKPPGLTANNGTVVAKVGGKDVTAYDVPREIARAMNADYPSASNRVIQLMGKLNRYLAAIHTAFSPIFQIRGLVRDATTVAIMGQQYDIPKFSRRLIKNVPAAMAGIREVLMKGTANSQMAQAFKELQALGGTSEFLGINDLEQQQKKLLAAVLNPGGNPTLRQTRNIWDKTLKLMEDYGKVAENSYRLAAFVVARQHGVPPKLAAVIAKRISVNFTQGAENKTLMNSLYLFYNANMSGNAGMIRGLKNKRLRRYAYAGIAAGAAMDFIMRGLSADEDEDGRADYDQIDPWTKQTNWILMNPFGPGYLAVPVPYGFNIFISMGRNLSTMASGIMEGKDPGEVISAALLDQTITTLEAFNPVGGLISILNFLSPTAASPIISLETNKDFAGRDIVPDRGSFGAPIPNSQKYYATTGPVPKEIAEFLNSVTGGNEVRSGMVDWSPESIRYVADFLTPDVVKLAAAGGLSVSDMITGQWGDKPVGDLPLLNKFYLHDKSRSTSSLFYKIADEVQTVGNEYDLFIEQGNDAALDKLFETKGPELELALPMGRNKPSQYSEVSKFVSGLRKLRDQAVNDGDKVGAREIEKEITAAMAAFNYQYLAAKGNVAERYQQD